MVDRMTEVWVCAECGCTRQGTFTPLTPADIARVQKLKNGCQIFAYPCKDCGCFGWFVRQTGYVECDKCHGSGVLHLG